MRLGERGAPRHAEIMGDRITVPSPMMGEPIELGTVGVDFDGQLQALGAYLLGCPSSALMALFADTSTERARRLGVTPSTVRRWTYHDAPMPRTARLLALSLLGLDWDGERFERKES